MRGGSIFPDWFISATAALVGLLVGSFLNVVIHRGPAMWGLTGEDRRARGSFAVPRSYCPQCGARIAIRDLIPILSYAVRRGRCAACGSAISLRYPIVECLGAIGAAAAIVLFGPSVSAVFAAIFLWSLIALAAIDWETGFLPDAITLPLIAAGLLANFDGRFVPLEDAFIGAAAGYGALFAIAVGYRALRGRDGLGGGDPKLLAAIGAWTGWAALPLAVFLGAVVTLLAVAALALRGRRIDASTAIPFGPGLCIGGAAAFLAAASRFSAFP